MNRGIFHAHIYFESKTRTEAAQLREKATQELNFVLGVSRLIDRAIGPHPVPMFEIDFEAQHLGRMVEWLYANRGGLAVLIHRDTKPEKVEHTRNAIWIGTPLPLKLEELDRDTDVHGGVMS